MFEPKPQMPRNAGPQSLISVPKVRLFRETACALTFYMESGMLGNAQVPFWTSRVFPAC